MTEDDISQEFRLKKIKEINNYFIKEVDQNELLNNKNKKVCTTLNFTEDFLTLAFAVTNICAINAKIKRCKSIINKKKKRHNKIALFAKINLNFIKDLISRFLTASYIERNYFI